MVPSFVVHLHICFDPYMVLSGLVNCFAELKGVTFWFQILFMKQTMLTELPKVLPINRVFEFLIL